MPVKVVEKLMFSLSHISNGLKRIFNDCPFKEFLNEKDAKKRVKMWESMDSIDFSDKLKSHEHCFNKNKL